MRRDQGTTLIFVLGILALLSLFAISFASVTRVERIASANYVDGVRANLAARAGIAAGVAGARDEFRQPSPSQSTLGGYLDPVHMIDPSRSGGTKIAISTVGISPGDTLVLRGGGTNDEIATVAGVGPGNVVTLVSTPAAGRIVAIPAGASWYYHGHSLNPNTTGNGIPIALALSMASGTNAGAGTPSFALKAGPTLASGAVYQVSGSTGGTYFADAPTPGLVCGGDIYGVKVLDAQGMLDANMEPVDLAAVLPAFGANVLAEVTATAGALSNAAPTPINNYIPLLDATGDPLATAYPNPFDPTNVGIFLAYRSALSGGRFRSKEQLKGAFENVALTGDIPPPRAQDAPLAMGDAWFTIYRDYFTCYGDRDTNDTQGDDPEGFWNPAGGIPGGVPLNAGNAVDLRLASNPNGTSIVQDAMHSNPSRMSVDLNTAPVPVLIAVLSTLRSRSLPAATPDPNAQALNPISMVSSTPVPMAPYPTTGSNATAVNTLTPVEQLAVASLLVEMRPFRSWNEVYKALNLLHVAGTVSDASLATVMAATCPVNVPLELNPDRSLFYWDAVNPDDAGFNAFAVNVDKASTHTCADFCFTSGYFEVEALGRVYANPSAPFVVAEAYKRCVVNLGGTSWVRGERDLSSQLSAGLMGAPAVDPNDCNVGGWVQPTPQDRGLTAPAGTTVTQDAGHWPQPPAAPATLPQFTPDLADGLLAQREYWSPGPVEIAATSPSLPPRPDVLVVHSDTSPTPVDQGQVEMWVKQPFADTLGTNEALFMNVRTYDVGLRHSEFDLFSTADGSAFFGENGPLNMGGGDAADIVITEIGTATRLERFGNQLYFCRFFWGYPDGASAPTVGEYQDNGAIATAANPLTAYGGPIVNGAIVGGGMHSYICTQALDWAAGTWHHVFIAWSSNQMTLFVDGQNMGPATTPAAFAGGAVWENTVQGFYPSAGSNGLDPNNMFLNDPMNPQNEADIQNQINQAQQDLNNQLAISPVGSQNQDQIAQDRKIINDGNQWMQGGSGTGHFITDARGDTFTAELGLRRMQLRTHLPLIPQNSNPPLTGPNESYFIGYKTPDPYVKNGVPETPAETVTLNFSYGNPSLTPSYYYRYGNGTFDGLNWTMSPSPSWQQGPTPTPHRYLYDPASNGTYKLVLDVPVGCTVVSAGYHVLVDHDVFLPGANGGFVTAANQPISEGDVFGGGLSSGIAVNGQVVTLTKTFPQAAALCNVALHRNANPAFCFEPGSDEVPWAIAGAWIAYEKPTTFLEGEEVD